MRYAPSLDIIPALQAQGARVRAFDPEGMEEAKRLLPGVELKEGAYAAAEHADAVVVLTEWDQFLGLDLDRLKLIMRQPIVVDLRNVWRPDDMRARGFSYTSVGRP
jgi:UDPglucose 6-dehydrogenase